ncbi:MAG: hypothetical protein HC913_14265 [Microscillaceae bacterium]|nr:hypothetical protein [Microscillaceae bacterium]
MSEFKLCENGHHFPQNLKECPYCPKAASLDQDPLFPPSGGGNLDKTVLNPQIMPGNFDSSSFFESSNLGGGGSLSRTQIYGGGGASDAFLPSTPSFPSTPQNSGRKLVGWLVSFTIDPNGGRF